MANPILNNNFTEQERVYDSMPMTVNGTIQITAFLGMLLVLAAAFVWSRYSLGYIDLASMLMGAGVIVGFILALIITFTKNKYLIPVYAVCEGMALGGISAIFEASYPGIVSQAVAGTFAALFSMLILYRTNVIRCTDKFRSVIFIATVSIAVVYVVNLIGSFFGLHVPLLNSSSNAGLAVSAVICVIAALNLIVDFDFIERASQNMLPKDMEWYGAFGLMVTLVWLYLEILRLLAKFNNRR
ncbi:Bax inhibitor-1/YccA family protein [bacterium]|nr:Bax inhibitor-1/YccA family protein [bacterium]